MTDVARCQETIANYVLDAGEAISYRSLASQVGGRSATRAEALAQFWKQNVDGVGAIHVAVTRGIGAGTKQTDPRARVIRISTAAPADADATIYGVYPSANPASVEDTHEAMMLAMWAQERKVRNELFAAVAKNKPLSRELRAFYDSDVQCTQATSRDMGEERGEEAVSMFDSIAKTTTSSRSQTAAPAQGKSSFFKSSTSSSSSSATTTTKSSSSFFGSGSSATNNKPKTNAAAPPAKSKTPAPSTAKRIDADAMSNVLTVDSDEDSDDGGAPKFVKSVQASKPRTKRVMISDDEEEDEEVEVVAPPAKKVASPPPAARPATKRKLSESPEPAPSKKSESPKRKREEPEEDQDEEPQGEDETLPTGPVKRRQLVTKTRINDDGYMVTEKAYEEVEVSVEELAKERAEAKKKAAAAQAAAETQKARVAAAAAASSKASKSSGPAKQKKLDFFFTRK